MPSSKFTSPVNNQDIAKANEAFTISMAIQNMETGNFVNAQANYFAAPQQLNAQGQIRGHSHVVVEALTSITQTTPTDPQKFAFFLGLNSAAQNGILTADVTKGLPAGAYKLSSINSAANHQPVIVPVAQHGALDDTVYVRCFHYFPVVSSSHLSCHNQFTIGGGGAAGAGAANSTAAAGGAAAANSTAAAAGSSTAASSAAAASSSASGAAAAGGKGKGGKGQGGKGQGQGQARRFIRESY
jgi:hypothetical protein